MKRVGKASAIALVAIMVVAGCLAFSQVASAANLAMQTEKIPAERANTTFKDAAGTNTTYLNGSLVAVQGLHNTGAISYTLGTNYVNNDVVTFTLSSGAFSDSNYYMVAVNGDSGIWSATFNANAQPFSMITKTGTTVAFRVTDDTAKMTVSGTDENVIKTGRVFYLVSSTSSLGSGATPVATANPAVVVSSLTTPGSITLSVSAVTGANQPLDNTGGNLSGTLFTSYTQYSAVVATSYNAVIDVASQRKKFEGPATTDTATITVNSNKDGNINSDLNIVDNNDTFTVVITGDLTGVSSIVDTSDNVAYTLVTSTTPNTATRAYKGSALKASFSATFGGSGATSVTLTAQATVTGNQILATRSFKVALGTTFADTNMVNDTLLASGTDFGAWTLNGWQGTIPYVFAANDPTHAQTQDTFVKIFNNDTIDAQVTVDITTDAGTTKTVTLATIPKGTIAIYWAYDIAAAAGLTTPASFGATFTVAAQSAYVTAFANQKRPGAVDRVIPIYHDVSGYKTW